MIIRVMICLGMLGFEDFGSKTPFLEVLDCRSSLGELGNRTGGPARPQLATARIYLPQRVSLLA
jgi:hypothetical protein